MTPADSETTEVTPVLAGLRWLFLVAGVLVLLAGVSLFVFPGRTDRLFAWTIQPEATSGFLGAGYFASVVLEFQAARERVWANVRVVVVAILVFTVLTLVATLVHLDRFHLDSPLAATRAITVAWLVIYAVVPVVLLVLAVRQARLAGSDPARRSPMATWVRWALGGLGAGMAAVGVALFVAPVATAEALWPWALSPLTGRSVGAWLIGMGAATVHSTGENEWERVRPMAYALVALASLHLAAVAIHADDLVWSATRARVYVVVLTAMLALGGYCWRQVRHSAAYPVGPQPTGVAPSPS